jgi:CheY-like chemotaxis protein
MHILVVDDEELLVELFKDEIEFTFKDATVFIAYNGVEALRILEQEKLDIVLTDGRMPEMNGIELAKVVRDQWPTLPIILLTGNSGVPDESQIDQLFDLRLKKPIRFEELALHLKQILSI